MPALRSRKTGNGTVFSNPFSSFDLSREASENWFGGIFFDFFPKSA